MWQGYLEGVYLFPWRCFVILGSSVIPSHRGASTCTDGGTVYRFVNKSYRTLSYHREGLNMRLRMLDVSLSHGLTQFFCLLHRDVVNMLSR